MFADAIVLNEVDTLLWPARERQGRHHVLPQLRQAFRERQERLRSSKGGPSSVVVLRA